MLTLDAVMQGSAEAALRDAVEEHQAKGGLVITIDPKNGDVLTLAEAPGFDPNRFRHLDYRETRARSFSDVVEAGSTMKVFLVASALDSGSIEPDTEFDTGAGWMRVRGQTIRDSQPRGVLRPGEILRVSSNIGAVQIAQRLGREAQYRGLMRFGFGQSTRSGFPMESAGLVRDWPLWQPIDQATIAFGQGLSVTAIQLASALAALANDGERMRPRLVIARRRGQGRWRPTEIVKLGQAVSPLAARQTIDMMRTVVSPKGTGRLAGLSEVSVAGKTGTAQKFDTELGHYSQHRYIAWFIGVVPAEDPELVIVVALDEPMGPFHGGGEVAAPLFARVAAAQLARRGILTEPAPIAAPRLPVLVVAAPPRVQPEPIDAARARIDSPATPRSGRRDPTVIGAEILASIESPKNEGPPQAAFAAPPVRPATRGAAGPTLPESLRPVFVPDFSGQTMTHALQLAQSESLILSALGATNGRVVSQVPVPGTMLEGANRTVRLRFSREEG